MNSAGLADVNIADYMSGDAPVRSYAEVTDLLDNLGVYGAIDAVGDVMAGFGMAGNSIVNGFSSAFTHFSAGDFLGGISAIWSGFTSGIGDVLNGIRNAFNLSREDNWATGWNYNTSQFDNDRQDAIESYYFNQWIDQEFYSAWYGYNEDWAPWGDYYCEFGYADPIILDLGGNGINLTSVEESSVVITLEDGRDYRSGWVDSDDAFLVWDIDGDNAVSGFQEIDFSHNVPGARSDMQALAALDSNSDGIFGVEDERFDEFFLWRDANSDGCGIQPSRFRSPKPASLELSSPTS